MTASSGELAEYDFPPRPEDPDTLAEWEQTMSHYKQTIPSNICVTPPSTSNGAEILRKVLGSRYSSNWSGYLTASPKAENDWVGVSGEFIQPYYHPTQCRQTRSAHWVGLGGIEPNGRLVQGGTVIGTDHKIKPFMNFLQPQYEHGDLRVPGINMHKEDKVRVTLFYEIANEELVINYFDNTTGDFSNWGIRGLPHQFYDGSVGDFVDERTFNLGAEHFSPLPNFDKNEWLAAKVYNREGNWEKLVQANTKRVFMQPKEHVMAAPGYIKADGKSFTNNFFRCSP